MSYITDLHDRRKALPPEELKAGQDASGHGRRYTYVHWLCRCPECRAENSRYSVARVARKRRPKMTYADKIERRRARPDLMQKQDESGHGRTHTYKYWLCRCGECTSAATRTATLNTLKRMRQS